MDGNDFAGDEENGGNLDEVDSPGVIVCGCGCGGDGVTDEVCAGGGSGEGEDDFIGPFTEEEIKLLVRTEPSLRNMDGEVAASSN